MMNQYEKLRLVGRGAYGTVYLCDRIKDGKRVILKEIPVDQMSIDERQASVNEAEVLSMLDHPNIVGYYESFLEEKTMTIVMEYVQGGTLFDYLKQRDGTLLEEKEVLHYFGQMVYTLQYVHNKQILHRDLKSQNILLNSSKNVVKIGDFGISKVLTSKSKAYTIFGTHHHLFYGVNNQKSDIWALGCILYELMSLKRPFDATTLPALVMKIMKGTYNPVPDVYSSELKKLLMSMLHLDPNQRPSADQIRGQPFMINVVPKLYFDIGSIPCTNRSRKLLKSPSSSMSVDSSYSESYSFYDFSQTKTWVAKTEEGNKVWFFESSSLNPIQLPPAPKGIIKKVSLGTNQKIGLTSSGLLISWQISSPYISVQDEDNNQEIIKSPRYVSCVMDERFAVNIVSVSSGNDFTICQSDNGVIFSFGKASSGCLGHSVNKDVAEISGTKISGYLYLADKGAPDIQHPAKLSVSSLEQNDCSELLFSALTLSNNQFTARALRRELCAYPGLVGIIEALFSHNIISIACGPKHALAVSDENEVYAWGYDSYGCLGLKKSGLQILPKEVEISYENMSPEKVFCGSDCSFLITTETSLLACGSNRHNKLALDSGEGHQIDEFNAFTIVSSENLHENIKFVSAGKNHTVFLCDNNEIYSVGSNQFFQLGWGQHGLNYNLPGKVEKLSGLDIVQITCCNYFTLAITGDNHLYCWGKCPKSFNTKEEICTVESPPYFSTKAVLHASCDSEDCLILFKEK